MTVYEPRQSLPSDAAFPSVVNLGMMKTGTSSMSLALAMLGYRSGHFLPGLVCDTWYSGTGAPPGYTFSADVPADRRRVELGMAVGDFPLFLPSVMKQVVAANRGALFIVTQRPVERWVGSVLSHLRHPFYRRQWKQRCRTWEGYDPNADVIASPDVLGAAEAFFGVPYATIDEDACRRVHSEHDALVRETEREHCMDILRFDVSAPEAWSKLCDVTGISVAADGFPRENVRGSAVERFWWSLRQTARYWVRGNEVGQAHDLREMQHQSDATRGGHG